jgi:hypothetical protein
MSDTSQGAGWWLASDGKWYPPENPVVPPLPGTPLPGTMPLPTPSPYPTTVSHLPYAAGPTSEFGGFAPNANVSGGNVKQMRSTNGLAIASLVCSCAGIIPFFFGITCVLGIIFGFKARGTIATTGQGGAKLALAGIIVGIVLIGLFVLLVVIQAAKGT